MAPEIPVGRSGRPDGSRRQFGEVFYAVREFREDFFEVILDRKVADKRTFPAIDITKSGTRKEELLIRKEELQKKNVLRRIINPMGTMDAIEFINSKLKDTKNNAEFFNSMNKPA